MERKWSMRAYNQGDEEKLLELWKAVHQEPNYYLQHWTQWQQWKITNPAGAHKICIAEHDGKIVGQIAATLVSMKVGTQVITGFQAVDGMTHPDYRRQGIFESLAREVFSEAAKQGVCVGYGFTNKINLYSIFTKKLDWFDVIRMPLIFKPSNWGNVLKLRLKNRLIIKVGSVAGWLLQKLLYTIGKPPVIEGLKIVKVPNFDERVNDFWERVSSQYKIIVVRNKDYLNWRYAIPDLNYSIYIAEKEGRVLGYVVLRCMQQEKVQVGIIFDLLAESEEIVQCLVAKAVEHCEQQKVDLIYASMKANKMYLRGLRRNGFIYLPFIKMMLFLACTSSPNVSKEFLKEQNNWLVQMGDSDYI